MPSEKRSASSAGRMMSSTRTTIGGAASNKPNPASRTRAPVHPSRRLTTATDGGGNTSPTCSAIIPHPYLVTNVHHRGTKGHRGHKEEESSWILCVLCAPL